MKIFKTDEEKMLEALKEKVSKMNLDAPNDMSELIDEKLNILFKNLDYKEYLSFIKSNKNLQLYDDIMGKYANNYPLSDTMVRTLNKEFYEEVLQIVINKLRDLNLDK